MTNQNNAFAIDADDFFTQPAVVTPPTISITGNVEQIVDGPRKCKLILGAKAELVPGNHSWKRKPAGYLRPFFEYRPADLGNADRVFDLYGDEYRYAPHLGWLKYNAGLWAHTEGYGYEREAVKSTIRQMGDALEIEYLAVEEKEKALRDATHSDVDEKKLDEMGYELKKARADFKEMSDHYKASCGEAKFGACLRTAASDPQFVVRPDQLDADDFKLLTLDGVMDLIDGSKLPHDPDYLMTRRSGTSIGPEDSTCPTWLAFLYSVLDDGNHEETMEMIDYIQVMFAYMLSGSTRFEALFILGGRSGGNGKSTFLNVVNTLLGSYGIQVDCKTFEFKKAEDTSIPNDIAKTAGSRVTTIDELPKGYRLNSPLTKKFVSGTTPLSARFLHKEFFEWMSKSKLMIATNFLPVIRDDDAMWRRIHLLKFNNKFEGARLDETLGFKLQAEMPAIMRWAQQGVAKLATTGLWRPVRVARDTAAYQASQDDFGGYLSEPLEVGAGFTIRTSQAWSLYKVWAEDNNHHAMSKGTFRRTMMERGFTVKKKDGHEVFVGVQVAPVPDLDLS